MLKGFGARRTEELVSPRIICAYVEMTIEPVFLNVYGAQESIPRNEFRQPM
jgi:hypothetical protein